MKNYYSTSKSSHPSRSSRGSDVFFVFIFIFVFSYEGRLERLERLDLGGAT